jgi:hypothetical protein
VQLSLTTHSLFSRMRSMSGSRLRTSFVAIIIAGNMHHLQMQNVHSQIITVVWQVRS